MKTHGINKFPSRLISNQELMNISGRFFQISQSRMRAKSDVSAASRYFSPECLPYNDAVPSTHVLVHTYCGSKSTDTGNIEKEITLQYGCENGWTRKYMTSVKMIG